MPKNTPSIKMTLINWARLLRIPNIFTVPGDPLLGFIAAGGAPSDGPKILYTLLATCCIYLYGLIGNDIADIAEDSKTRPKRPLPSKAISLIVAKIAMSFFALAAIGTAFFATPETFSIALLLLGLVTIYNFAIKRDNPLGPFILGLCRAGSIAMGTFTVGYSNEHLISLLFFASISFFYIFGVSRLAQNETRVILKNPGRYIMLFGVLMWTLLSFAFAVLRTTSSIPLTYATAFNILVAVVATLLFVLQALKNNAMLAKAKSPTEIQHAAGSLIRNIILFQLAACGWAANTTLPVIFLLAMLIFAQQTGRKFYSS